MRKATVLSARAASTARTRTALWFLLVWMTAGPATTWAQLSPAPATTPAPAPDGSISEFKEWDPLKANKDMEVGTFYFKKGQYDAAIDRFEEAARVQPGLARPYVLLGETYEKTKNLPMAVASYRKYLELFRAAPDGKKISKRIEELEKRIARQAGTR
jgi:tetratricopeptide (TPR) repeat protein